MKRSKSYRAAVEKIDADALYAPLQAVRLAKETSTTKYDATVEVAMRLGVDPRKADQMVRGTVNLPHGTGKTARVLVFATGERAEQATAAGVKSGSATPHSRKVGSVTQDQVREIAQTKMADLNANDLDAAEKIIAGTARQMGITVEGR